MKSFRCGDVVSGCTRAFHGTEDSILTQVAVHAREDHAITAMSDELITQIRGAMVLVAA